MPARRTKKMKKGAGKKGEGSPNGVKLRPCAVCEAGSTGYHFGVMSCEACKSFFRRSLKRQADMVCAKDGHCNIKYGEVKGTPCPACRVNRCLQVGMSLDAVKKGRYTLERRAETIMESRKYWTSKSNPTSPTIAPQSATVSSTTVKPDSISNFLFGSSTENPGEVQTNGSTVRPAKRSSHSFSSTSSSFDSDSGLQLQDDLVSSESMLSLLSNNDPILLETEAEMDISENNSFGLNDVFMPKSLYGSKRTESQTLKSLLTASTTSPFYKLPSMDVNTPDPDLITPENCMPMSALHDYPNTEEVVSDTVQVPKIDNSALGSEQGDNVSSILKDITSNESSLPSGINQDSLSNLVDNGSDNDVDSPNETQSQSQILDKLLGLKTLFKDPKNTTEFKTDYLKGFNTEKQDCESLKSLFNSIQHPADALDIALAKADDENLSKLIDQTIEAFDKQNFLTRGFLAKLPDYQHRFLLEREEKEKLFGPMKPLSFQEHKQIFDETGIDVDGRQALLQHFADSVLVPHYKKVAAYITSLPGVRTLPADDQHALLKCTKAEMKVAALFPTFNVTQKLYTISEGQAGITLGYDELLIYHSKDVVDCGLHIAGKLQDLELTDQEYAMVAAVCIVKPEVCVTEEGRDKCCNIRSRMFKALERLLCRRLSNSDTHKVISEVHSFIDMFRDKRNTFNAEWDDMFTQNLHVKWPSFVWDLFTTAVPQSIKTGR